MDSLLCIAILRLSSGASFFHSCHQRTALHAFRNLISCKVEQCGGDVQQSSALVLAAQTAGGGCQNEHSKLRVIAAVRTSVVFLDMNSGMTYGPNRTPIKTAEMNDQVRRHVAHIAVDFFGFENQ